jgi:hypothetical protein
LTVVFDLAGLSGLQDKSIQVHYDRGPMILLSLKALLAEAPSVSPSFLTWTVGQPAVERVAVITMPSGVDERAVEVTASSPDVAGTLHAREDGTWALAVIPASTAAATNVMLTVRTDLGRVVRVFASIAPP